MADGALQVRIFALTILYHLTLHCIITPVYRVEDFQHPLNVTQVDPVLGASSKTIVTMPKDNQRVTLAGSKLIITELLFGKRTERLVQDRDEYQRTLKELFGIDIDVDDKEYPLCIDGDMQSVLGLPV